MHCRLTALVLCLLFAGCAEDQSIAPENCAPHGPLEPICGFSNPEDFALLPDGHTLIVSEYGGFVQAAPGALAWFDTRDESIRRVAAFTQATAEPGWGAADCPGPPGAALSPHGLDLSRRDDGSLQLLVVNHGGGERIEFIEVQQTPDGYAMRWRGCLLPPDGSYINSVAATPEGGLVMSHMYPKDGLHIGTTSLAAAKSLLGFDSGHVIEWTGPGGEFRTVGGSRDGFPNGVLVSPDGRHIYMAASTGGVVAKLDRQSGQRVAELQISHPDNLRWDGQGDILVATMPVSSLQMVACQEDFARGVNCGGAFEIFRIEPERMAATSLLRHPGGQPLGMATVAQRVGEHMYLGSFAGNRILRAPYPQ